MKREIARTQAPELADNTPSLRQRLRLLGRDAILDAASELFLRKGYRTTTMTAVAEGAGVGVATVFRYFKTKEGILAALSRRDIDKIMQRVRAALASPRDDPADAILQILLIVLDTHEMPSTGIRGQTRLWLLLPTGHPETDEVVTSSDRELQELILEQLKHYRRVGRIRKNLDLQAMTTAIFAVFYHYYLKIGLDRSVKIEDVRKQLASTLPLLFTSWTAEKPSAGNDTQPARSARARSRR